MASLFTSGKYRAFDASGAPLAAGQLFTYAAGTLTPLATFTTQLGNVSNANHVVLDSAGKADVWLGTSSYRMILKTAGGVTLEDTDGISGAVGAIDLSAATGSSLVGHIASGAGAVATTAQAKLRLFPTAADRGAVANFSTDNTAAVLAAVNALGIYGGTVVVPDGSKFNLRTVGASGPARFNLDYRADDDTSVPGPAGDIASSERVNYSQNSSFPADVTGAEVNEWRLTGPFHPGLIVDVRKDVIVPAANLRAGQSQTNPARATIGMADEQSGSWAITYENYSTWSAFSGVRMRAYRNLCVLSGIGTANWVSAAAVNTVITGLTSGAKGFLVSIAAGSTTVIWFTGRFVVGESLSDNNETASGTISAVAFTATEMQPISQDLTNGNWAVGLPPGTVPVLFGVGGKIAAARSRTMSQFIPVTVNDPGFVWVDSFEGAPPNGFEAIYDTSGGAAIARIVKRKYGETTNRQVFGSLSLSCTFGNALSVNTKQFGVGTVGKPATGRYLLTFANALASAEYQVSIVSDDLTLVDRDQRVTLKLAGSFEVRNYNAAGALADLVGNLDVKVHLGDI